MQLEIFNKANNLVVNTGAASINVDIKNGFISFSLSACIACEFNSKTTIEFAADKKNPKDWYFFKSLSPEAFQLRPIKNNRFMIQNRVLAKRILNSLGLEKNALMLISKEPVVIDSVAYYPIITKSAKTK